MVAVIDRTGCIGCGLCGSICPEVFLMASDGKAEAFGEVTEQNLSTARDAATSCPVSVIEIQG